MTSDEIDRVLQPFTGPGRTFADVQRAEQQKFSLGLDSRIYNNDVAPAGASTSVVPDYVFHPLSLTCAGVCRGENQELSFTLSGVQNIPGVLGGDQAACDAVRPGAEASYSLGQSNRHLVDRPRRARRRDEPDPAIRLRVPDSTRVPPSIDTCRANFSLVWVF